MYLWNKMNYGEPAHRHTTLLRLGQNLWPPTNVFVSYQKKWSPMQNHSSNEWRKVFAMPIRTIGLLIIIRKYHKTNKMDTQRWGNDDATPKCWWNGWLQCQQQIRKLRGSFNGQLNNWFNRWLNKWIPLSARVIEWSAVWFTQVLIEWFTSTATTN